MRRILLVLGAALALLVPPGEAPADDRPDITLRIETGAKEVRLGDAFAIEVVLERRKGRPLEIHAPRLARNSVSLLVRIGEVEHRVTRIHGEIHGEAGREKTLVDAPPPKTVLVRGRPLTLAVPLVAIQPGTWSCRAVFDGMPEGYPPLESEPVEITVTAPGSDARIGAILATTEGSVVLDLWPERAFNTVLHFLLLARDGFYDGLTFHRVSPGHLVQGGDPKGDGTGGPGYSLPDESDPTAKHEKGVISLARAPGVPDTGGSQFFLLLADDERLDGYFTAFGRVAEGMEVLDRIAARPVAADPDGESSRPLEPPLIRTIRPITR